MAHPIIPVENTPPDAAELGRSKAQDFLRDCLAKGWPSAALNDLNSLWWRHHDAEGAQRSSPAPATGSFLTVHRVTPGTPWEVCMNGERIRAVSLTARLTPAGEIVVKMKHA